MEQYYTLENGIPVPAKLPLREQEDGLVREIYTPTPEQYAAHNCYPMQTTAPPPHNNRQSAVPSYELQDGIIVQSWSIVDIPPPYIDSNTLDAMEGAVKAFEDSLVNSDIALDAMEAIVDIYEMLLGGV